MYTIAQMRTPIPVIALSVAIFVGRVASAQVRSDAPEGALTDSAFARIWSASCTGAVPKDSGLVYGVVRDAKTRSPVADANVDVVWTELAIDAGKKLRLRRLKLDTHTNAAGVFGVCGVPNAQFLRIGAGTNGRMSALIDIPPGDRRVVRRDLAIGAESDTSERGIIYGTLIEQSGAPLSNARVVLDDSTEARTSEEGRFILRNVATVTRQIEVLSIGMVPVLQAIDVAPNDSTPVRLTIRRITALDAVRVSASRRARAIIDGLEERKRAGVGRVMEAGDIYGHADLVSVFREFPGVGVDRREGEINVWMNAVGAGSCWPSVWLDGVT